MIDGLLHRRNGDELRSLGYVASGEDANTAPVLLEVAAKRGFVELFVRVFGQVRERACGVQIHQHRGVPEFEIEIEQGDAVDRGRGEGDGGVEARVVHPTPPLPWMN